MPGTYYNVLDPLFETAGLISASHNADKMRSETVQALNEMGINGDEFYSRYMPVFDDYVHEFRKHYTPGISDALFFEGIETGMLLLILSILTENRSRIQAIDQFEDSDINAEIIELICELYQITPDGGTSIHNDHMSILEKSQLSDSEKWKLLKIMNSPKIHLQQLVDSINANRAAFEAAQKKISVPLKKLIAQYAGKDEKTELFGKMKKSLSKTADVYPSLAFPISQMIFSNCCYYGLLSSLLINQDSSNQNTTLRCLKALGDASRLEILRLIKKKPMYNLEIAEQLGLTAATMSHHMSILLSCGFVGVTKQESKVYYHLENEFIHKFIKLLEKSLI